MSRRRPAVFLIFLLLAAVPALADATLAQTMRDVERIRALKFKQDVRTVAIDRDRLPVMLRAQMQKGLPYSWDDFLVVLRTLRLVDPSTPDVQGKLIDLLQQQVLAFYDPDTHVYYSINQAPKGLPDTPPEISLDTGVAAHELTHALQDQYFDIGGKDRKTRDDADGGLALHAVAEGEATLVMLGEMSEPLGVPVEKIAANDVMLSAMSAASQNMVGVPEGTPRYFVQSLAFPYVAGLKFVTTAFRKGGWDAVNKIYANPPKTTREVLHPDEYFAGKRTASPYGNDPAIPVRGHLLSVEHLGEWHWGFLVGAENARGWRGDRVTLAQNDTCDATALIETKWDTAEQAAKFRDAYAAFLKKEKIDARVDLRTPDEVDVAYGADDVLIERFMNR